MSFTEQKSIIWGHYWARKGCQIGKHELQRRYIGTLEPPIRNCCALFYQRWFAPSWMLIVTVKLNDGKIREYWRWICLTNPWPLACWSWLTGHPFLTELDEVLTPIPACSEYGRFQTAVCFGLNRNYVSHRTLQLSFFNRRGTTSFGPLSLNLCMFSDKNYCKVVFFVYWHKP